MSRLVPNSLTIALPTMIVRFRGSTPFYRCMLEQSNYTKKYESAFYKMLEIFECCHTGQVPALV